MTTKERLFDLWKRREAALRAYQAWGMANVAPDPTNPDDERRRFEIEMGYRRAERELLAAELAYSEAEKQSIDP